MTDREQFEAWARSVGWPHYATMSVTKAPDFFSDLSWDVWQAARAQSSTQNPVEVGTTVQAGQVLSDAEICDLLDAARVPELPHGYEDVDLRIAHIVQKAVLAKRVPMTDAQIEHALRSEPMADNEESFALGIRYAERHHGIGGEKEGA